MDCHCCLEKNSFTHCLGIDGFPFEFRAWFKYKKGYFGIRCNHFPMVSSFLVSPNYFLAAYLNTIYLPKHLYIYDPPSFKDGKSMCRHCKKFLDNLRGKCQFNACVPTLEYL
jgi:hypothetical protein